MLSFSILAIYIISLQLNVLAVFLLFFISYLAHHAFNNNQQYELHWQENGQWIIAQNNHRATADLCDSSVVTSICSVLNFKREDGRLQSILLFKDNIDSESFRRLRVRVKVQGLKPRAHATI